MNPSGLEVDDRPFELSVLRDAVRYQQWILSPFEGFITGCVLEIGAGNGNLTRWIAPLAEEVVALEPDPGLCRDLEELRLPNVSVVAGAVEAFEPERPFDAAVMANVLEHVEDDAGALAKIHDLLHPGGSLCLLVPAHPFLFGSLDEVYGHFRRYRKNEVRTKLEGAGFDVAFDRYFNMIGAVAWLIAARVLRQRRVGGTQINLADRIMVPLGRFLERRIAPPFGQSVVALGIRR